MKKIFVLLFLSLLTLIHPTAVLATYDPLSKPNNKYGIHLIQPSKDESNPASTLVNTNGDWGYVTILIEGHQKDQDKWQQFFDELRRKHLIPIIRLATSPEGSFWKRPSQGEEIVWADFLDSLNWPTKNRYIITYNEPNHATEWGNTVNASDYAKTLDKTITALKNKNPDFFVLNAGLDASSPEELPRFQDELSFLQEMEAAVPGIFNKLDGWVSHSYPNPDFIGSPYDTGRRSIRGYLWELQVLKGFGLNKELPIFITETGWKHSDGKVTNKSYPSPEKTAEYYKIAFETAWNDPRIVAITPFLLNYQAEPFDHFSFKKQNGQTQNSNISIGSPQVLAAESSDYHPMYQTIQSLSKTSGQPLQTNSGKLLKDEIHQSLVAGETYNLHLTFRNTGQSIWNDQDSVVSLKSLDPENPLNFHSFTASNKTEPAEDLAFDITLKAPEIIGQYKLSLNLFNNNQPFDNPPLEYTIEVKSPVTIKVKSGLTWKNDSGGEYILTIISSIGETIKKIVLNSDGQSPEYEARFLLPDEAVKFTLEKPYYKSKTIEATVKSGQNTIEFGELNPSFTSAILKPRELWKLLPLSN